MQNEAVRGTHKDGKMNTPIAPDARRAQYPCFSQLGVCSSRAGHCEPTKVIVGVSSPALLYGLQAMIVATDGLELCAAVQGLADFHAACDRLNAGVALVDPALGGQSMSKFLLSFKARLSGVRLLLLTDLQQPTVVREAVKFGASGFVHKTADAATVQHAIAAASRGQLYLSASAAAQLAESLTFEELTRREMEVVSLLAQGKCNKTIARDLDCAVGTVKTHMRAISNKFRSTSRTEVVLKAHRLGLVDLNH